MSKNKREKRQRGKSKPAAGVPKGRAIRKKSLPKAPTPASTIEASNDASCPERLYSINALSEELRVDRRTLKKHLAGVAPAKVEGKSKLYRLADVKRVIDGEVGSNLTLTELRIEQVRQQTRETKARADLLELERKEKLGDLVPLSEVAAIVNPILLAVRQRLNAMPSELSILVNPTDPQHAQQQAMAWVERVLPMIRESLPQPAAGKNAK